MGSPVGPIVANLFMEWFEKQALATFRAELQLWKRYIDDAGVAMEEGREEEDDEKSLPMLDVKTQRGDEASLIHCIP